MILSSMSVMFMTQVTVVAAPAQVADEQVGEQERAEVADVGRSVDGRAARVDADPAGRAAGRTGASRPTACRAGGGSSDRLDRGDDERRDRPACALGPVEVAGRGLDADGVADRARAAPRSPRASVRDGRRAAAGPRSRSGPRRRAASPAASTRRRTSSTRTVLATPRGVRSSAGKSRPRSPSAVAPSSASASGVEDDVAVRVAGQRRRARDLDAAEAERHPRPERVAVVADPGPRRGASPTSTAAARWRSLGSVTLRLPGSPGTTWTGMPQASSRAASSVNVSRAVRRVAAPRLAEQVPSHALRRLRRPERRPVDRRPDAIAVDPLERSPRRGTTGIAAPWRAVAVATAAMSDGVDQRPRRVVDEDHARSRRRRARSSATNPA